MKFYKFSLGKGKLKNCYKGYVLQIFRLKFEVIIFGKKKTFRIEYSDWREK